MEQICSLGNISANVKGTHKYDDVKERPKSSKSGSKKMFATKFFRPKIFKKLLILAIFGRKMAKTKNFGRNFFWWETIQNGPNVY